MPETAWVSVFSIGLFDAAVATGSIDMPETEPGPLGTCPAYAAQLAPTRSAAGSALAVGAEVVIATLDEVAALLLEASGLESFEQAATPRSATALRPAAVSALR